VDSNSPGPHPKVLKAFASGTSIIFKGLSNYDDVDNGYGIVEYDNGKSFMFHLSRTNVHGHDVQTEIYGDKGKFVINQVSDGTRRSVSR
jgi:myo-inositol 2-dehydrogenase/D-chiro-inositol 1-dehydrogenase